jgi:metal-responsive CopG/Arc/MetJ family transcriptional regulator
MPAGEDKQFRWSQSIPEDWLPYLDEVAAANNKTRVGFVRDLIREAIPNKYHKKLSEPQQVGRPNKEK